MLLGKIVEISEQVSATSNKKAKVSLIARLLREANEEEIFLAVQYLSGNPPQGRLGVGWKTLEKATRNLAPSHPPLGLMDLDAAFETIARESWAGSAERKIRALWEVFSRSQRRERDFLMRLIMGEVRQGALEGLVLEAVARHLPWTMSPSGKPLCFPVTSERLRGQLLRKARLVSPVSAQGSFIPSPLCWPPRSREKARRKRVWERPVGNIRSTALEYRSINQGIQCGSSAAV